MNTVRNSVRAAVVREGKILLVKMREPSTGEIYYLTPGGGQNPGETFLEALRRECREETGAEVRPLDVILIREYIGKNHKYAYKHNDVHQVEYFFPASWPGNLARKKLRKPTWSKSAWNGYPVPICRTSICTPKR